MRTHPLAPGTHRTHLLSRGVGTAALVTAVAAVGALAVVAIPGASAATAVVGTGSVLPSPGVLLSGYKGATQYPVARAGTITAVSVYLDGRNAANGTQNVLAAVYADSSNTPGKLLGSSAAQPVAAGRGAGWVTFPLGAGLSVTAGSKVWLTAFSPGGANVVRIFGDSASGFVSTWNANPGTAPSTTFGTNNRYTGRTDLYATETVTAAPTTTTATPSATPTASPSSTTTPALATWRAALAGRATAPARWVAIGESLTEGQGASTLGRRWLDLARDQLRATYPTANVRGGENYIPAVYRVYGPDSTWGSPWSAASGSLSPAYWAPDLGYRALQFGAGASATYPVTGDTADIWYAGGSGVGTFTYQVDKGTPVAVNTNGLTYHTDYRVQNVALGAAGGHTITITATTGPVYLEGFSVFNGDRGAGIQVYDSGYSGATAATFLQDLPEFHRAVAAVNPQLVTVELGGNDYLNQNPPATFGSQMRQLVTDLESLPAGPSIELIAPYQLYSGVTGQYGYQTYVQQLKAIAAADPAHVSVVDLSALMPPADTSGTGDYSTDGLHPNDTGQQVMAKLVFGAITR